MEYSFETVMMLVKDRMDRLPGNTLRDVPLKHRIEGAIARLERLGIRFERNAAGEIETITADDLMLIVDLTVWMQQNRDKGEDEPKWLRRQLQERWMNDGQVSASDP